MENSSHLKAQPALTETQWRPCPICGERKVEVLHHQKFIVPKGYLLPGQYDVDWCPRCGMAYADTSASQEEYDRYYADWSKYEHDKETADEVVVDTNVARLQQTAAAIAKMLPNTEARITDIGCANGGLLGELKKLGFGNLVGIDPSPLCVRNTAKIPGMQAHTGGLGSLPQDIGTFDLVILSHVLEHVRDLHAAIENLRPLVNPGGFLYVEVPDASRYARYLVAPFQDFNTEHINHFHAASLRELLERHNFVVRESGQKEVETSPGCPYPAAFVFAQATDETDAPENTAPAVDGEFRRQLVDYVALSRDKIQRIDAQLAPFRERGESLIVWGTGQLAMKLLAETSLAEIKIDLFVDGNPINQGKELLGVPVAAPDKITDTGTTILIASLLHDLEIEQTIREKLKLPNPVLALTHALASAAS